MSGIPKLQYHPNYISPFSPGKAGFWLVLTFLMVFAGWSVVGQTNPTYSWEKAVFMGTAGVSSLDKLVISVDVDSKGNIYALTFGKKILKYNANGGSPSSYTLQANIEGPVDMAINSQDEMYVADYEGRTIFAFDLNGNNLVSKNKSSSYFKPLGIAFDKNDNLYVADYNDGSGAESTPGSRLKIHYSIGGQSSDLLTNKLIQPYRLDLDSKNNIYISHVGSSGKGEVKVFNENFQEVPILTGITSPGSIVVDNEDFIHVIDYAGKVNFQAFIKRDLSAIFNMLPGIRTGVKDNLFNIQVYDSNGTSIGVVSESSPRQIDFPLDMAFNYCFSKLYLNDAYIGTGPFDFKLDFNLEIFKRAPDFDTEKPLITCRADILKDADPGKNYAVVSYANPAFSDNCSTPTLTQTGLVSGSQFPIGQTGKVVTYNLPVINDNCPGSSMVQTAGLAPGSNFPVGITPNTFVVTDASGKTANCSFTVTVIAGSDTEAPVITCPAGIVRNVDPGICGAIVNYTTPAATDNSGSATVSLKSGPSSGSLFPVGKTTVTFEATDAAGNKADCSYIVTVIDNENPTITCPSDKTENYDPAIGFNLPDYTGLGITNDNCGLVNVTQSPTIGTLVTENTQITLTATDEVNNFSTCIFMVNLSENEVLEITCPSDQLGQVDTNCQFIIPDYTSLATVNFQTAIITQSPLVGTIVSAATIIKLTATLNGQTDDCSFQQILEDTIAPVANCAIGYDIWLSANGTASLNATEINKQSSDNCGIESIEIDKTTFTSVDIGVIMVTLTVIDVAGNSDSCETSVTVHPYDPEEPSEEPFQYIFIYPNPTPGPFTFDTPNGWSIEKVEVYDARGRYVLTETFSENQIEYSMDLRSLQQAVYILKLYTSQGIRILRVIIN